jgi:hypothetical protein
MGGPRYAVYMRGCAVECRGTRCMRGIVRSSTARYSAVMRGSGL